MRDRQTDGSTWIRPDRLLWILVIVVLLSAVVAVAAYLMPEPFGPYFRIILEFGLGTWPNQDYSSVSPADLRNQLWLPVGVFVRTVFVLAVPVMLGLWVVYLTAEAERRIHVQLTEYLHAREGYIEERVYLTLVDTLAEAGFTDEKGREIVARAFQEGRSDFEAAEAPRIREAIRGSRLPNPRHH